GTDATASVHLGNGAGIRFVVGASGAPDGATVGGGGTGNVIAFNQGPGIAVVSAVAFNSGLFVSPSGIDIQGNSIVGNTGLGIALEQDGVTPNDAGAAADGANGLQNFPIVTDVTAQGDDTEFDGTLDAAANTQYRIEFFENDAADPSGNGEGQGS